MNECVNKNEKTKGNKEIIIIIKKTKMLENQFPLVNER